VIALPEFLAFLVGLYFIIQGALLFFDYYEIRRKL
jgi:uncharacterized membrane protein HdeD (DUF308 family)